MTGNVLALAVFALGTYSLRIIGLVLPVGRWSSWSEHARLGLVPAILASLVATATFTTGSSPVIDARFPAVVVAWVLAKSGRSGPVVIVASSMTAALIRLLLPHA